MRLCVTHWNLRSCNTQVDQKIGGLEKPFPGSSVAWNKKREMRKGEGGKQKEREQTKQQYNYNCSKFLKNERTK